MIGVHDSSTSSLLMLKLQREIAAGFGCAMRTSFKAGASILTPSINVEILVSSTGFIPPSRISSSICSKLLAVAAQRWPVLRLASKR
ncbi:hypothetical protein KC19_6G081900 [Ceratodon purpureus]|uniref:Uncharacterized protein n=1 Tax=Ceratodon purpureus TaxID=3225 RepID=A0A8T0HBT8_CERPU|nr:hypothetical protein KC19_6G081900 [Ceratodon purpureus]